MNSAALSFHRQTLAAFALVGFAVTGTLMPAAERGGAKPAVQPNDAETTKAQKVIDGLVDELADRFLEVGFRFRYQQNQADKIFLEITPEAAREEAEFHRRMLQRLEAVDVARVGHRQALEADLLRHIFEHGAYADADYWLEFAVTPYTGADRIIRGHTTLGALPLATPADRAHYLQCVEAYGTLLDQAAAKTRAQAERGIRVAKPAIEGVRSTFQGLKKEAVNSLLPSDARLAKVAPDEAARFKAAVRERISARVEPACDAVLAIFDERYVSMAPPDVGLWRYPGGKERYLRLLQYEGYNYTPQQIQDLARDQVAQAEKEMAEIRRQLGFAGTADEFHAQLRRNPRLVFQTPEALERQYQVFLERIEPKLSQYFHQLPKLKYGFKRLDPAVDNGQRGGGAQGPTPADPVGRYVYPTFDLVNRSLEVGAAHRIYHELIPGHVFQGALFRERRNPSSLSRLRLRWGGYAEGWAEYAASLGKEMGVFSDPYDLYLQLLAEANNASRSVIDTGMNYFGMTLEEGRAYLRAHSPIMSDVAVNAESLRFAADNFAYALSYRMGFVKIWEQRRRAEQALGPRFDLRDFHAAVMDDGAMPMDVLDRHIDWYIAQHAAK